MGWCERNLDALTDLGVIVYGYIKKGKYLVGNATLVKPVLHHLFNIQLHTRIIARSKKPPYLVAGDKICWTRCLLMTLSK